MKYGRSIPAVLILISLFVIRQLICNDFAVFPTDQNLHIWLGGLFIPEAYITATRQFVAQANSWSLEELHLQVSRLLSRVDLLYFIIKTSSVISLHKI